MGLIRTIDEFVNVDLVPLQELIDAVLDGKIEDAKPWSARWRWTRSVIACNVAKGIE